jgi:hypothetical protein
MEEEWRAVKGYEGLYEVSNLGRVRSLRNARCFRGNNPYYILSQCHNKYTGYMQVHFKIKGVAICKNVHRLVAESFLINKNNYPVINHKDRDKTNNNVKNLEWCTQKYNTNYLTPAKSKYKSVCMIENFKVIKIFPSITHAVRFLRENQYPKACVSSISWACKDKRNFAYGYKWKYKEEV